jgi:uncharacterized protein with FMN-binding domain
MKRLLASVIVVVAFTLYAIFSRGGTTTATPLASTTGSSTGASSGTTTTLPVATGNGDYDDDDDESAVAQQTANTVATAATTASSSGYTDGTYTGSQADALYGSVQVQVTIQGGSITNVQFLSHPTGHNSDQINARAVPLLTQEAIAAQSASVQVVSGATLTSQAFMQSLQSALSQA